MYSLEEFKERFKSLGNHELLEMLDNAGQYQSVALQAAREELAERNLDSEHMTAALQILSEKKETLEKRKARTDEVKKKITNSVDKIYDELNPILEAAPGTGKLIRITCIIYAVLFLYSFISESSFIYQIITGAFQLEFGYTLFLFPIFILIPIVIFFWKKSLIGWVLLCANCCFLLPMELYNIYYFFDYYSHYTDGFGYIPPQSLVSQLAYPALHVGTLYLLYKKEIREVFQVSVDWRNGIPILFFLLGVGVLVFLR